METRVGACLVVVGRSRGSEPLFDEMKSRLRGRNRRRSRGVMYPGDFIVVQSAFNAPSFFFLRARCVSMTRGYARTGVRDRPRNQEAQRNVSDPHFDRDINKTFH